MEGEEAVLCIVKDDRVDDLVPRTRIDRAWCRTAGRCHRPGARSSLPGRDFPGSGRSEGGAGPQLAPPRRDRWKGADWMRRGCKMDQKEWDLIRHPSFFRSEAVSVIPPSPFICRTSGLTRSRSTGSTRPNPSVPGSSPVQAEEAGKSFICADDRSPGIQHHHRQGKVSQGTRTRLPINSLTRSPIS